MHYSFSFTLSSSCRPSDRVPFRLLLKLLAISCSVTVASSSSDSSVAFLFTSRFSFSLSIFFASFCGTSVALVSGTSFQLPLQVQPMSSDRFLTSMSGFLRLHEILPIAAVGGGSPSMMTTHPMPSSSVPRTISPRSSVVSAASSAGHSSSGFAFSFSCARCMNFKPISVEEKRAFPAIAARRNVHAPNRPLNPVELTADQLTTDRLTRSGRILGRAVCWTWTHRG